MGERTITKASWFVKMMYGKFLRGIIKGAIDDPDDSWDENVMRILDDIFDYNK